MQTRTTNPTSSFAPFDLNYQKDIARFAVQAGDCFSRMRDHKGQPVSEGMVYAALGLLYASKARDQAEMDEITRNLTVALYHAFRLKPPK